MYILGVLVFYSFFINVECDLEITKFLRKRIQVGTSTGKWIQTLQLKKNENKNYENGKKFGPMWTVKRLENETKKLQRVRERERER